MRPPTLWESVDCVAQRDKKTGMTSTTRPSSDNDPPASRIDVAGGNGLRRSLSSVVEQDAKRIAELRSRPSAPRSHLNQSTKAIPMTSPRRGSTSASRSVRNVRWNAGAHAGASSPGGWAEPMGPVVPRSDDFNPVNESPNTAIRRIFGTDGRIQSLDLPLSDDGMTSRAAQPTNFDWSTDLSAFFDVEAFSLDSQPARGRSPAPETTRFHHALSSGARRRREETATEDDDAISQLFNGNSSVGNVASSSPPAFDFSQLPPSSPPMMPNDLPHSALLLSSPDTSSIGFSPLDREILPRFSPEKKSNLKHSFTPDDQPLDPDAEYFVHHDHEKYDALSEFLEKMHDPDETLVSSAGVADGMMGGDMFQLLDPSFSAE